MRRRLVAAALFAAGCATVRPQPPAISGQTHQPYEGKPAYLSSTWTREHPLPGEPAPGRQVAAAARGGSDVMIRSGGDAAARAATTEEATTATTKEATTAAPKEATAAPKAGGEAAKTSTASVKTSAAATPGGAATGATSQETQRPPLNEAERLQRIRALLAAIDGHLAGIDARGGRTPTPTQQRALALTIEDLGEMLEAFPDVQPEGDELRGLVERLPDTPPARMAPMIRRMQDLADLILLQIFVGR